MTVAALPLLRRQAYLDGRWVDSDSGETFPVTNPASGETIAEVPRMGAAETGRAIEAAARAYPEWRSRTAKSRASVLRRLADLMLEHKEEHARLLVTENGKPLAEAQSEIDYAAAFYQWFAEEATRVWPRDPGPERRSADPRPRSPSGSLQRSRPGISLQPYRPGRWGRLSRPAARWF